MKPDPRLDRDPLYWLLVATLIPFFIVVRAAELAAILRRR